MKLKWAFLVNEIFHSKADAGLTQVQTFDFYITSQVWHHCLKKPPLAQSFPQKRQEVRGMWRWRMWAHWQTLGSWGWSAEWTELLFGRQCPGAWTTRCLPGFPHLSFCDWWLLRNPLSVNYPQPEARSPPAATAKTDGHYTDDKLLVLFILPNSPEGQADTRLQLRPSSR